MRQEMVQALLRSGANVFLTGPAGSGKTYVLRQFIAYLREHDIPAAVTASTGIAATHLEGMTIHAWSGLGVRDRLDADDLESLAEKSYVRKHFARTRVLIIDEVSMLHARQLDMVDRICRHLRDREKPFGGLQVVLSGDFFQLPPVSNDRERALAVYADAWAELNPIVCYLTEQFRQRDDALARVLSLIRLGVTDERVRAPLRERYRRAVRGEVSATSLYTHNSDVDAINNKKLDVLPDRESVYTMRTSGSPVLVEMLKRGCLAPEKLRLKIGAAVMFVKNNYEEGYVNGTMGTVTGFDDIYPRVKTFDGKEIIVLPEEWSIIEDGAVRARIVQVPLRLAWAITVHKSQGMTLDAAEIDLSRSFVPGMGYVALSRLRSLDGLRLLGLNDMALTVSAQVCEIDARLRQQSRNAEVLARSDT